MRTLLGFALIFAFVYVPIIIAHGTVKKWRKA
jgi:hypothetical protein